MRQKLSFGFVLLLFLLMGQSILPGRASEHHVFYNHTMKSVLNYTDEEVKFDFNGSRVNLHTSIGLLGESGSALAPLVDLFQNVLGVSCEYSLKDSSITLSEGSDTVKITPGSNKAIVNGKTIQMSEVPMIMQDAGGSLKLYVPTRFLAQNLGFDYEWNKTLSTVYISKTETLKYSTNYDEKPIEIPLYGNLTMDDIRIEDMYYNKQIAVYIPGDYTNQYKNNVIVNHYSSVNGIELAVNSDNETVLLFCFDWIRACKAEVKNHTLYLSFLDPREVYSKIVVIDSGHGGFDPGAIRENTSESNLNLSIAYEYTKDLFAASDIKAYYTRVNDKYLTLDERAAFAAQVDADCFISVHQNTNNSPNQRGTSVYYSRDNENVGESGLTGRLMAEHLAEYISGSLGLNNLGRIDRRMTVTTYNSVPAALIELAFMSNGEELNLLMTKKFREQAGQAIFDAVVKLFETYPTERSHMVQ